MIAAEVDKIWEGVRMCSKCCISVRKCVQSLDSIIMLAKKE